MFSRFFLVSGFSLAALSAASAADLGARAPAQAAFNWSGFYVGADAGYLAAYARINAIAAASVAQPKPAGFTFGAHLGYRHQYQNNVVIGAEIRGFGNFSTKKSGVFPGFAPASAVGETQWGGDLRLTLGYAMDRFLPYLSAGLAIADGRGCGIPAPGLPCVGNTSYSDARIGWTVGAGAAYALTNNLIARLDYSYSAFPNKTYTLGGFGGAVATRFDTHAIRVGLSYKF